MTDTENDERKPLLSQEVCSDSSAPDNTTLTAGHKGCRCRPCFLVEPILILFAIGAFPLNIVSQKYTIDWFTANSLDFYDGRNSSDDQSNTTISPCNTNTSHGDYDYQQYVQSEASQFALYQALVSGIPAIFVTVILGAGSDRYGRRFAIIPPLIGTLVSGLVVSAVILTESSVYWILVGSFINGAFGSLFSMLMACLAYVADRTTPERRLFRIVIVEVSLLISGAISPIVNGTVLVRFGYFYPLLFVIIFSAVNLIYTVLFFPKNTRLQPDHTVSTSDSSVYREPSESSIFAVLWNQVCSMFNIFFKQPPPSSVKTSSWRRSKMNLLMAAFFVTNLPAFNISVTTLFEMNSPLCWDLDTIGLFTGLYLGVSGIGALIVTPLFKICHTPDFLIAIIAGLASLGTSLYKVFVVNAVMMFIAISPSMLQILFTPSLRTLLSSQVSEEEQGALFGAIACIEVICMTFGEVIFNSIYSATLSISTGFVFFVMAVFYLVGCILVCVYAVLIRLDSRSRSRAFLLKKSWEDIIQEEAA